MPRAHIIFLPFIAERKSTKLIKNLFFMDLSGWPLVALSHFLSIAIVHTTSTSNKRCTEAQHTHTHILLTSTRARARTQFYRNLYRSVRPVSLLHAAALRLYGCALSDNHKHWPTTLHCCTNEWRSERSAVNLTRAANERGEEQK